MSYELVFLPDPRDIQSLDDVNNAYENILVQLRTDKSESLDGYYSALLEREGSGVYSLYLADVENRRDTNYLPFDNTHNAIEACGYVEILYEHGLLYPHLDASQKTPLLMATD
jgi:hypothetical protein